jgi:hypothetical protein
MEPTDALNLRTPTHIIEDLFAHHLDQHGNATINREQLREFANRVIDLCAEVCELDAREDAQVFGDEDDATQGVQGSSSANKNAETLED